MAQVSDLCEIPALQQSISELFKPFIGDSTLIKIDHRELLRVVIRLPNQVCQGFSTAISQLGVTFEGEMGDSLHRWRTWLRDFQNNGIVSDDGVFTLSGIMLQVLLPLVLHWVGDHF